MKHKETTLTEKDKALIRRGLAEYAQKVEAALRELKINPERDNIVYVGGGANIMKEFATVKTGNIRFLGDVRANAIGYEYLANMLAK